MGSFVKQGKSGAGVRHTTAFPGVSALTIEHNVNCIRLVFAHETINMMMMTMNLVRVQSPSRVINGIVPY